MSILEENYKVSNDYEVLHDLVTNKNLSIIGFGDVFSNRENKIYRHLITIKKHSNGIHYYFGDNGGSYKINIPLENKILFLITCKGYNISFIEPNKGQEQVINVLPSEDNVVLDISLEQRIEVESWLFNNNKFPDKVESFLRHLVFERLDDKFDMIYRVAKDFFTNRKDK